MDDVMTTVEVLKSGSTGVVLEGSRRTPAALQIASHKPPSLRSGWA